MNEYEQLIARGGLSLERLVTLCKVVDEGGLAKAAGGDISRLSQYSRQMKDLESFFGFALLCKIGRVAIPTTKARELAGAVRIHLKTINGFIGEEASLMPFVIGASQSVIEWFIAPRLGRLRASLNNRPFTLMVMRSREVAEALEDHRLDLGLVRKDALPPGLGTKPIFDMSYALFAPKALVGKQDARTLLETIPLAISMGGELRRQVGEATAKEKITMNVALQFTSFSLCADAVRRGLCAAILPTIAEASLDSQAVVKLPLPFKVEPSRKIVAGWHRASSLDAQATYKSLLRILGS
jgi:DNA-binding transcriptional LysR family regulator